MTARYIPKSAWSRKGQAKHFTSAKMKKAARAEKAWLKKSKTPGISAEGAKFPTVSA